MKYDAKIIGERIKHERKQLTETKPNGKTGKMSQEGLAAELGYSDRKVVGKWETGKEIPPLDDLLYMCEPHLFDCELGYLLGEYPTKTRAATDIQKETGLSEAAINALWIEAKKRADELPFLSEEERTHAISSQSAKLNLIDAFIRKCDPISNSLFEIMQNELIAQMINDEEDLALFNRIYDSNLFEYEKLTAYIDEAYKGHPVHTLTEQERIDNDITEEGIKEMIYRQYQVFLDRRTHGSTNHHRHNMTLAFNQIIDNLLNFEIEGKGNNNGEHKEK